VNVGTTLKRVKMKLSPRKQLSRRTVKKFLEHN